MYLYVWLYNAKMVFVSETLFGVIIVVVGRVFCQDDCGANLAYLLRDFEILAFFENKKKPDKI